MSKFTKMSFYLGIIALCALIATPFIMSATAQGMDQKLKVYLDQNKATPKQREAYEFAIDHPEVIKSIPCYCGCGKLGHKSNLHCFVTADTKLAKSKPFDDHGFVCPMCVDIALASKKFHGEGKSIPEIRRIVDRAFTKFPQLQPTPTPKPAE